MATLDLGCGGAAGDGRFDAVAREYRLHARGPVRRGQQVLLCYGVHTNLQLLGAAPRVEDVEDRSRGAGRGRVMWWCPWGEEHEAALPAARMIEDGGFSFTEVAQPV